MKIEPNLVSVIMPAHNSSRFISESISSVLKQTYPYIELLIVDDRSTDNTLEIAKNFAKAHQNIKVIVNRGSEGGAYFARNLGLDACSGQYVAFLDSDDIWTPRKIALQIETMKASEVYASHTAYTRINEDGSLKNVVDVVPMVTFQNQLKSNHIANLTGVYDRSALGVIKQQNIHHEDYLMWLEVLKLSPSVGIQESLALYRVSNSSLSANKFKSAVWHYNVLRSLNDVGFIRRFYFFINYIFYALIKRV